MKGREKDVEELNERAPKVVQHSISYHCYPIDIDVWFKIIRKSSLVQSRYQF